MPTARWTLHCKLIYRNQKTIRTFDELNGECKYHILKTIRKCIKRVAIVDQTNRLTKAAQRANNRIKSRQILRLLYDHLRTATTGEQSFRIIELKFAM